MHKIFRYPNFLKFWSDVREIFRHCETIIIRRKNVIPPVMHKIFRYPKFSGTLKGCPRNILALWDQKFSTENRDTPSSLPPPLIHNFYSIPDCFWYTDQKGSPTKFFSTETKKNFDTKSWDKFLKHKIFRYPKLVTHWRSPPRNFSALWDRHFLTENRDTPSSPPPLIHKFFSIPDCFWYTDQKGPPTKFFSTETKKISTQNREINLWSIKSFDTRN